MFTVEPWTPSRYIFRSKTTGQKRRCVALTSAGEEIAKAYNAAVAAA